MLENLVDDLTVFNKTQQMMSVYQMFSNITNHRPLGNKTLSQMERVVDGYGVIMNVVNRFNTAKVGN